MITICLCYRSPMQLKFFLLLVFGLVVGLFVWLITGSMVATDKAASIAVAPLPEQKATEQTEPGYRLLVARKIEDTPPPLAPETGLLQELAQVEDWIANGQSGLAANYINDHYSEFSSAELDQFKLLFLKDRNNSETALAAYRAATEVFDDLESWDALANASILASDWSGGFKALLRASDLENSPEFLEDKLAVLVKVTSHLRADMEKREDQFGIKALYQNVYERHPNYPRFQLELAYAHLRLGENNEALRLLSGLVYDPDFGTVAQQALDRIQQDGSDSNSNQPLAGHEVSATQPADIVVPLVRSGTSFLVDTSIDNRRSRLLLDTGASITALSSDLIQRLSLSPTGQVIQINTANGSRSARLFRTGKLRLGRFQLTGLVVAEIDLEHTPGFDGLLGTDALNHLSSDYSYLIDNENNSLIFRRR